MNQLQKVAATLEAEASSLDNDGIGAAHAATLRKIVAELRADATTAVAPAPAPRGLTAISMLECAEANPARMPLLKQLQARASRLGLEIDPTKPISVRELDKAFAGKNSPAEIRERLQIKIDLGSLSLLPLVD